MKMCLTPEELKQEGRGGEGFVGEELRGEGRGGEGRCALVGNGVG